MVGVAKRPKAPDCGSGIRGFESHHPPHKKRQTVWSVFFYGAGDIGIRKGGTSGHTGVKIESWRAIFSPWENPSLSERIRQGCETGTILLFLATHFRRGAVVMGFERLNATRTSVAGDGWTEPILYFRHRRKCKRIPHPPIGSRAQFVRTVNCCRSLLFKSWHHDGIRKGSTHPLVFSFALC